MGKPLKVLYLRTENSSGTLSLFVEGHRRLGTTARYVTLFPTAEGFAEDICLDLPLTPKTKAFRKTKSLLIDKQALYQDAPGHPPVWKPSLGKEIFFRLRDQVWRRAINKAVKKHELYDYDIYHLEGGHGFFRTMAWPFDELKQEGKHIIANYHGVDMRTRGVFPWIDDLVDVNLTSEVDLLEKHSNIQYLYLPYDVNQHQPRKKLNDPIRICHATRDRYWKGSDVIIEAGRKLEQSHGVEFVLIENQSHEETLKIKAECDIYIDQVANLGGWGYGMNSVEALSMGLCCCTNLLPEYETFLGEHPFINVQGKSLYSDLISLVSDHKLIEQKQKDGRAWVEKTHDINAVMTSLYRIYQKMGWIEDIPHAQR
jgi:hypothetical protein